MIYFIICWLGDASRAAEAPGPEYRSYVTGLQGRLLAVPALMLLPITSTTAAFCSKLHKTKGRSLIGWMEAGQGRRERMKELGEEIVEIR